MRSILIHLCSLGAMLSLLSGCSKGGEVTIEPGAIKDKFKGAPYVVINQGGRALIVEQGKTANTGVHGWIAIQTMTAKNLRGPSGEMAVMNKSTLYHRNK